MNLRKTCLLLCVLLVSVSLFGCETKKEESGIENEDMTKQGPMITVEKPASLPKCDFQKEASFPDRLGGVDDTLAMNSVLSFKSYKDQGTIYLSVEEGVESFDLYVNSVKCEEDLSMAGNYKLVIAKIAVNGSNSLQISNIEPEDKENVVSVFIPYPGIIQGSPEEEGFRPEAFELISDLIQSDIDHGFPSAQLAVISHGKLIYARTWGALNSYEPDGSRIADPVPADNDTMYDLASVTKMFSANYAIQKLVSEGKIDIDEKVYTYLGERFYEDTLDFCYDFGMQVAWETMKDYKASITIRDLMKHEAGFPPSPRYFNIYVDAPSQEYLPEEGYNLLYSGYEHGEETKEKTIEAICQTPLVYEPGSEYLYSDVDYMILGLIVEEVSGQDLDTYMKENFFKPMGLKRISFEPLKHGFGKEDCAATELNGNTRDGAVSFPGVRTYTLQGEVHDEMAYYSMNGVSGHAGLFANAVDLAKLASLMLNGGYEGHRFFSRNVIDTFISPTGIDTANSGLGWARQGDDQRSWYYGSDASSFTVGHQGWTGTLVMIDPQNDLVMAYLTNERNTKVLDPEVNANDFDGLYYTTSTLGFVPQIFMTGKDQNTDIREQLSSLLASMAADAERLIPEGVSEDHPAYLNYLSKTAVKEKWNGQ
ncbi:MAG: penicillin binding protein PBP4B [Erysipelotrichaceae bacterium]|nr:penicillin binding protein PBP4B [Erysipelotrichaceae bacterium]